MPVTFTGVWRGLGFPRTAGESSSRCLKGGFMKYPVIASGPKLWVLLSRSCRGSSLGSFRVSVLGCS